MNEIFGYLNLIWMFYFNWGILIGYIYIIDK